MPSPGSGTLVDSIALESAKSTKQSINDATELTPSTSTDGARDQLPGIARMEVIARHLTRKHRLIMFMTFALVGLAYGLASPLISVYQSYATASFEQHSLLATSNTLRLVFAVAAQPTAAKLADIFGRLEVIYFCATLYIIGLIVQASSSDIPTLVAGSVINQMGLTTTQVLVEILIADLSSTRARVFCYTIPNLHFIFSVWVSGNISNAMLRHSTWRWGIGMWAIVYAACLVPFVGWLKIVEARSRRHERTQTARPDYSRLLRHLCWRIDLPGLILLVGSLALILTPLTLAGGVSSSWRTARTIVPIIVGFLCIPALVVWELRAPYPMVPFAKIRDRSIWGALGIALCFSLAAAVQRGFLYTVLIVAFNFSVAEATRVSTVYSFVAFVSGPLTGLAVYRIRRLKPFLLSGALVFTVAFGLLVRYRGGLGVPEKAGVIAGQVLLGLGGGMCSYPAAAMLQITMKRDHVAIMVALYFAVAYVGSSVGSSISGSIWTQVLPQTLADNLAFQTNATLAMAVYANPFALAAQYPVGTEVRTAIIASYEHVQRLLCITGLGLCAPLLCFSLVVRNPRLNDEQTLAAVFPDSEKSPTDSGAPRAVTARAEP